MMELTNQEIKIIERIRTLGDFDSLKITKQKDIFMLEKTEREKIGNQIGKND